MDITHQPQLGPLFTHEQLGGMNRGEQVHHISQHTQAVRIFEGTAVTLADDDQGTIRQHREVAEHNYRNVLRQNQSSDEEFNASVRTALDHLHITTALINRHSPPLAAAAPAPQEQADIEQAEHDIVASDQETHGTSSDRTRVSSDQGSIGSTHSDGTVRYNDVDALAEVAVINNPDPIVLNTNRSFLTLITRTSQNARAAEGRHEWAAAVDDWNLAALTGHEAATFTQNHEMLDENNNPMANRWNQLEARMQQRAVAALALQAQAEQAAAPVVQQNRRCTIM